MKGPPGQGRLSGKDIAIPTAFPFEEGAEGPVVYYRLRRILWRVDEPEEGIYVESPASRGQSLIDLRKVAGFDLDFFFSYPEDVGGNRHTHDVESIETRIAASRWPDGYFAVGVEWDQVVEDDITTRNSYTVTETGIKFRFDFKRTPLRFFSKLGTPFWGFRVGLQMRGVWSFDTIGHVFESGAGSW